MFPMIMDTESGQTPILEFCMRQIFVHVPFIPNARWQYFQELHFRITIEKIRVEYSYFQKYECKRVHKNANKCSTACIATEKY